MPSPPDTEVPLLQIGHLEKQSFPSIDPSWAVTEVETAHNAITVHNRLPTIFMVSTPFFIIDLPRVVFAPATLYHPSVLPGVYGKYAFLYPELIRVYYGASMTT